MEKLEWTALEYEERERSGDWFWALGVIVVATSAAAVIYANYFFAGLIILSGVLLGFFAKKKPDVISYELNSRGLKIRTRLYPYENIQSFWVQIGGREEGEQKPILFIKSERLFMPVLSIPINDSIAEDVQSILLAQNIPEEEMRDHPAEKIMESLGILDSYFTCEPKTVNLKLLKKGHALIV